MLFYHRFDIVAVNLKVAMGEDAVEIDNKLLEVMRPFVAKLRSIGILQNRDYRTVWYKSFDAH